MATKDKIFSVSLNSFQKLSISAFMFLILTGCAAFDGYPKRATDIETDLKQLAPDISVAAMRKCREAQTVLCRNSIISSRMYATDILFSEFEETLFRESRKGSFSATLGTLGLTSAAAVTSGGASQVLSGVASLIIGGREAFQKEVLAERTVIAIHTAMRAKRTQIEIRLREGMKSPIGQYPIELGLRDLDAYYKAGTILDALIGITETVGAEAQKAENELKVSFNKEQTVYNLRKEICGNDSGTCISDKSKLNIIQSCLKENKISLDLENNSDRLEFLYSAKYLNERSVVIECMSKK